MSLAHELNGRREVFTGTKSRPRKRAQEKQRVLALVDGTEQTNPVVQHLLAIADMSQTEVIVLNVQPEPENWRLRGYESFKQEDVRARLIEDLGRPVVTSVAKRLDAAGISHRERIVIGDPATAAAAIAAKENCDLIVIGESRAKGIARMLVELTGLSFNSQASRLVQLAETPVVIVK